MVDNDRISRLHQRFMDAVADLGVVVQNAAHARRIPHTLSLTLDLPGFFPFMLSDELAISSTSACSSAAGAPSHVLTAIGLDEDAASRTVRLSLGRYTTQEDVDHAIACVRALAALKAGAFVCHRAVSGGLSVSSPELTCRTVRPPVGNPRSSRGRFHEQRTSPCLLTKRRRSCVARTIPRPRS
jgi:hypothetical protein